ncbi:hypothetical protein J3R82DRAFT_10329 [Butyriboletus roseoflavus]|nr:hypothetical protein J3R82DRAFT_10329 [Butyriboletus roseoflavus]
MVTGEAIIQHIHRFTPPDRYCIPMDKLDRAIQTAEEKFFQEFDPGNVPVVVLFTKFDALLPVALGKLEPADRRLPLQERLSKAEVLIDGIFSRANAWGRLSQMKHAPKLCVQIGGVYHVFSCTYWVMLSHTLGMHKSNEGCKSLLENTANVLDERALQMLLVSAQETNIGLCIKYAVE